MARQRSGSGWAARERRRGRIIRGEIAAIVVGLAALVGLVFAPMCGCTLDPGQIGMANRQAPTASATDAEQDFAAELETVVEEVGELMQVVESVNKVVTQTVGANSGDNWTTRLFVGGLVVVGSVAVCWHRRRFHKHNGHCTPPGIRT